MTQGKITMNIKTRIRTPHLLLAAFLTIVSLVPVAVNMSASAASLTQTLVRFDRMKISTATTGTVCAKPATVGTEATVAVTFPTGYTLGTAANFTVDTTTNTASWPTGGTAWLGIGTGTNVTGQVVTFPSTDLVVGTLYCFNWINSAAVSVKSSATSSNTGTVVTQATGPTTIDTGNYSTASVTDDSIVVTATVPAIFQFALSANTDALLALSSASVTSSPTPRTATVSTNAKNGWMLWAKDLNTGLNSATVSSTIPSTTPGTNSTQVAGTAGYNTGVTAASQTGGTGTVTPATAFDGTTLNHGGGLDTTLRAIATSTGTADTSVVQLKNNVAISGITPAASDYTDTITVIGAGLF
jgi:hypothetical protein